MSTDGGDRISFEAFPTSTNATSIGGIPVDLTSPADGDVLEFSGGEIVNAPRAAPGPHASTHAAGGTDPVSLDMSQVPTGQLDAARIGGGAVSNAEYGYLDGVTSAIQGQLDGKQAADADLTAVAALSGTGLATRTAANTWTTRSVAQGTGITVTNGDGVAGNPTVALTNSSLTVSAGTGLTGGGSVALGGTTTISAGTELAGVAGLASTGLVARTAAGTYAARTLTQPSAGLTVSNGGGVAGNPTLALANDLSAVEGLASTGIAIRTATDTWAQRSIAQGTGITVTNGDGVSGNPTVAIDSTVATLSGFQTLTNKTISSPTLSGTASGTYSLGGTPSLGTALNANGFKITSLGAPASSTDAARMDYAVSTVILATSTNPSAAGFWYFGTCGPTSMDPTVTIPWVAPYAGTMDAVYWQSNTAAPGACFLDIRKGTGGAPPYSYNLVARLNVASGDYKGNTGLGLTVSAGDTIIILFGALGVQWNHDGLVVGISLRRS